MTGSLTAASGETEITAEARRLCTAYGDPEAANLYGWTDHGGLFRIADVSERRAGSVEIGQGKADIQSLLEQDVAEYVRLRARRAAIGSRHEPAWSLVAHPATIALAARAGAHLDVHLDPDESGYEGDDIVAEGGGVAIRYVYLVRGMSLIQAELGDSDHGAVSYWSASGETIIHVRRLHLPETVMVSMAGMRLADVMPHPLLDPLDLHIRSVHAGGRDGDARGTHIDVGVRWEPLVPHHEPRPWLTPGRP